MKTPIFRKHSCWNCPALVHARTSYESSYCAGFAGKKRKRFTKALSNRQVPNWCPKRLSPPICKIYGFINDEEAMMEFMLNHGSSILEHGMAFPSEHRYKLRGVYQMEVTAKKLYESLQEGSVSDVFPDEDFEFGELVEFDDGFTTYCFYYAGEKGFVMAPTFHMSKSRHQQKTDKSGGKTNGKK